MSRFEQPGQDWGTITVGVKPGAKRGGYSGADGAASGPKPGEAKYVTRPGQHQAAGGSTVNQQHRTGAGINHRKLAEDTETFKHKTTSLDLRIHLQQARTAKGWTQKELAQQIQEKDTTVKDYESGKAIPNGQLISKMERALGVHLRGQNAGQPLQKPQPKAKPAAKPAGKKGK
eukprot:TRINITY_DN71066_c0_g1_i1.p3 TRINITY_DN71066_c0_g1~~TRINITY_DN71066_c0_g1_i1.p3  ORF type:complete len:174 (+),score=65.36 TRINITY_DN71066_c0_g1_i1:85-606(+)